MHRLLAVTAFAFGAALVFVPGTASADRTISVARQGNDLSVVVHGITDYCSTNASIEVIRHGDTIRIVRDRPTKVSRCMSSKDVTVTVKDVPAGTYRVTYEQIPYVAPARALTLASTTTVVD